MNWNVSFSLSLTLLQDSLKINKTWKNSFSRSLHAWSCAWYQAASCPDSSSCTRASLPGNTGPRVWMASLEPPGRQRLRTSWGRRWETWETRRSVWDLSWRGWASSILETWWMIYCGNSLCFVFISCVSRLRATHQTGGNSNRMELELVWSSLIITKSIWK